MEMNEYQIKEGLRKHWHWLKNTDHENVSKFIIAHGKRTNELDDKPITKQREVKGFNIIQNILIPGLVLGWIGETLPINIDNGYSTNWGMVISFILVMIYGIYAILYNAGKVKGKYILVK